MSIIGERLSEKAIHPDMATDSEETMKTYRLSLIVLASLLLALPGSPSLRAQNGGDIPWGKIRPTRPPATPPALTDSTPSFYKRKAEWKQIIDEYWGHGVTLQEKQNIFDSYANYIQRYFTAFEGLNLSWDSLRAHYSSQIHDSTSHGRFSAILSYLAYHLREPHTTVLDYSLMSEVVGNTVVLAYPSWGKPLWFKTTIPTASHFGAVLTPQADSSSLVIRAIENHPLGLKRGDIVLGYEGVPWRQIARELLAAEVPTMALYGGSKSMEIHHLLGCAGFNWHLFDTIDIVKYPTGDTLHLPVDTLASIRMIDSMYNNESLEIPGVPWPDWNFAEVVPNTKPVSHGIVDGTNIGYIYVALHTSTVPPWSNPSPDSEERFNQAVTELWDTDGLIIDLRHDRGGRVLSNFNSAFRKLLNFDTHTLDYYWRASGSNLTALAPYTPPPPIPVGGMYIDADEETVHERPIAVLVGPGCVSMGDATAYRLTYFPNTRFFGKPTSMGLGGAGWTGQGPQVPGYVLGASDMILRDHYNPVRDLERMEFPVDELVWLTREDVANGDDTVVKRALDWITTLAYAHDVDVSRQDIDTVRITAHVENPLAHTLSVVVTLTNGSGALIDSIFLADDGLHGDSTAGDGLWGYQYVPAQDDTMHMSIRTDDQTTGTSRLLPHAAMYIFTRRALISVDTRTVDFGPIKDIISRRDTTFMVRNIGFAEDSLYVNLDYVNVAPDSAIDVSPTAFALAGGDSGGITFTVRPPILAYGYFNANVLITSRFGFGQTSFSKLMKFQVVTDITETDELPTEFALEQNYPNPFNPVTKIQFSIVNTQFTILKVYDLLGREVATLVNEVKQPGTYTVQWDGSDMPSGVYFYRLTAGEYVQTKKAVLMK